MKYKFNIVTTFAERHSWGFDMVKSCDKFLPENCSISVYLENPLEDQGRVFYYPLDTDRIERFEKKFKPFKDSMIPPHIKPHSPIYNQREYYLWDGSRFCHKVFCMENAAKTQDSRYLVWIDADVLFHSSAPEDWLNSMIKEGCYTSYLHRRNRHAETGFIIFDTHHPYHSTWWDTVAQIYEQCQFKGLTKGWTDSHVHDYMIAKSEKENVNHIKLSENAYKAWDASILIKHCRHFKGYRINKGEHGTNKF